ncbi:MAG: hypothetical protein L0Z50_18040 [Verrucomicrobiales bacterium]|nr:hypothetical protein [Verrucomicrobiales bacterium]
MKTKANPETGIQNQIIMKTYLRYRSINPLKNFFGVKLQGIPPRSLLQCLLMAVMVMVSTSVGRSQVVVQNLGAAPGTAAWPSVQWPVSRDLSWHASSSRMRTGNSGENPVRDTPVPKLSPNLPVSPKD